MKNGPKRCSSAVAREVSEVFLARLGALWGVLDTLHVPKMFGRAKNAYTYAKGTKDGAKGPGEVTGE